MFCDCWLVDRIDGRADKHDHLNCWQCHPILEAGETVQVCGQCGKKMLVRQGESVIQHGCGRRYVQMPNGNGETVLKQVSRAKWWKS